MNVINIYSEWNQSLTQYEILVVGNKGDKVMKYSIPVTQPVDLPSVVLKINQALIQYNELD